jgi:antitoxin HigA-1
VPLRAPTHPGRFLQKYFLTPLGLTQTEAARRLGISRRRLNEVIQGHRSLTPDTAIRFALLFGGDTAFWLQLQSAHDCFHAWKQWHLQPAETDADPGSDPGHVRPPTPTP